MKLKSDKQYCDDRVKETCYTAAVPAKNEPLLNAVNMNKVNYQKELDKLLEKLKLSVPGEREGAFVPTLFLHSCCAPCSSYVLEYLCGTFQITVFYFNPNISESAEYIRRVEEQKRLIEVYNRQKRGYPISVIEGDYEPRRFFQVAAGLEDCPEGGERCFRCFDLRLRETAVHAREGGYDYFGTTLTISPLKNAQKLNEIGNNLAKEYGIPWLPSDFKKRNGYKRSVELSAEYDLYRQDYCGCAFSKAERERVTFHTSTMQGTPSAANIFQSDHSFP